MSTELENNNSTILIIDDNANNRLLLASQLEMHGFQISEAADGKQGLAKAKESDPDLILLDVMMPFMDGFETCKQLKKEPLTKNIPVIMVTALRDVKDRIEGIKAGADEFLSRPHNREELLIRVKSLINLKHARDKLEEERNRLKLLYEVTRASTHTRLDIDKTTGEILNQIQMAVGAAKGSLIFRDSDGEISQHISIKEGATPKKESSIDPKVLADGLAGRIFKNSQSEIIHDTSKDDRWLDLPNDQSEAKSAIGIPLFDDVQTRGVLILSHTETGYFTEEHKELLEAVANQVTIAIQNAYLFNQVNEERQKLEAILAQSSDAIVVTDEAFCIEMINQAALTAFNEEIESVLGTHLSQSAAFSPLLGLFDNGSTFDGREINGADDLVYLASVTSIRGVGYLFILQDLTERKLNEEMRLEAERFKTEHVKQTFQRYMSPNIVERLLEDPEALNNKRILAVVLFADLRNSTGMILNREPVESINILNQFFSAMANVVHKNEGTIFDMVGDELMIAFNAPLAQDDAPMRALNTAISLQTEFHRKSAGWLTQSNVELGLGIGIDMGYVVMGNIGREETRLNFGLVGGTVNMGKRLVDKANDREIVISEILYKEFKHYVKSSPGNPAAKLQFTMEKDVDLKGNPDPQKIYRTIIDTDS